MARNMFRKQRMTVPVDSVTSPIPRTTGSVVAARFKILLPNITPVQGSEAGSFDILEWATGVSKFARVEYLNSRIVLTIERGDRIWPSSLHYIRRIVKP